MYARLSYSRNLLIQNKLSPLIREPNFHDSFRKTIRYYIFSGIRPPISLSFSQAIRQVSVSRGDRHPYLVPDIAPSSQMSPGMY